MRPSYDAAATAWRDHLRGGGVTPWCDFIPDETASAHGTVPPPVNLELLRRLNLADAHADPDLVLQVSSPGRGMVEERLPWPEPDEDGRTPLQPEALPPTELTRLAAAVIARHTAGLDSTASAKGAGTLRPRVHVYGAPVEVARLRASFRQPRLRRWTPGAVVVAPLLPALLTQVWSARVQRGAILPWARFATRAATSLPKAARLDALTAEALRWHPAGRVHVVLDGAEQVPPLLGARPAPGVPAVAAISPEATELVRWFNVATRLWSAEVTGPLRSSLVERLPHEIAALAIPKPLRASLTVAASQTVGRLRDQGVVVHGDPDAWVAEVETAGRVAPAKDVTADLAVATLVDVLKEVG